MRYTTLISTQELADLLQGPAVVVVDCRFNLMDTSAGEREYAVAHIPGAVYAHLDRDLSGPKTGANGRHPLPDIATTVATFSRLGIDATKQVVAYDRDSGGFASRLWWMLRWLGHDPVAVLDGGFAKWTAEGRPTRTGVETRLPRPFVAHVRPRMLTSKTEVAGHITAEDWRLVDARAPERYRGEVEPIDPAAGHIPGAINVPFLQNISDEGTFRSRSDLEKRFRDAIGEVPPDRVVCYCGSGVTACQDVLAMEHAGLHGAKLYAGSWSEWCADPSRPVERSG